MLPCRVRVIAMTCLVVVHTLCRSDPPLPPSQLTIKTV